VILITYLLHHVGQESGLVTDLILMEVRITRSIPYSVFRKNTHSHLHILPHFSNH